MHDEVESAVAEIESSRVDLPPTPSAAQLKEHAELIGNHLKALSKIYADFVPMERKDYQSQKYQATVALYKAQAVVVLQLSDLIDFWATSTDIDDNLRESASQVFSDIHIAQKNLRVAIRSVLEGSSEPGVDPGVRAKAHDDLCEVMERASGHWLDLTPLLASSSPEHRRQVSAARPSQEASLDQPKATRRAK